MAKLQSFYAHLCRFPFVFRLPLVRRQICSIVSQKKLLILNRVVAKQIFTSIQMI